MRYKDPGVFSIWLLVLLLNLYLCWSFFSIYITSSCHFILLFICYHVWTFIYTVAVLSYYHSDYITCSGYFRLSVYTWGILLAYIRRQLSSRPRFHVFWEAGRDNTHTHNQHLQSHHMIPHHLLFQWNLVIHNTNKNNSIHIITKWNH